jgi:RimJ/RimL family protein N-acetyltransferase
MNTAATLSGRRVCLRAWRDVDRDAIAAINADARVMEFFRAPLSRTESDADHVWYVGHRVGDQVSTRVTRKAMAIPSLGR